MLGFHVAKGRGSLASSVHDAVAMARGKGIDIRAAQVFVMGPKTFTANIDDDMARDIRSVCVADNINLIVHGSYVNHPFGDDHVQQARGVHFINEELRLASIAGAIGVVIHLPRRPVSRIVEVYRKLHIPRECQIYLEIESMKSSPDTYETSQKIRGLFTELLPINPDCGLCVDTAHKWSSGFDNRTYGSVKQWCDDVDSIGIRNIAMHLSDSNRQLGSGLDNHASVTHGNIWSGADNVADTGLAAYVEWALRRNMITILERDQRDLNKDFKVLRPWFGKV